MIRAAGARFSPNIDSAAPNLKIASVTSAIHGLLRSKFTFNKLEDLAKKYQEKWEAIEKILRPRIANRVHSPSEINSDLKSIDPLIISNANDISKVLKRRIKVALTVTRQINNSVFERISRTENHVDNKLTRIRQDLNHYFDINEEIQDFLSSPQFQLLDSNLLLVIGEWGTGKTHSFCDLTDELSASGYIVNFSLAKNFSGENPLEDIASSSGFKSFDELCLGAQKNVEPGQRALIIIDGINEGNRVFWSNAVSQIVKASKKYSHLGFILTCRIPFEHLIIKNSVLKFFVRVHHQGFHDRQSYEAQKSFFQFYDIPLPEVPLLAEEFSRPLTLKLICETIKDFSRRKKKDWVRGISNGQKGMTAILEDFIVHAGREVEQKLKLSPKFCWSLIKGDTRIANPQLEGLAPVMALTGREYVSASTCKAIIGAHLGLLRTHETDKLYGLLIANGVLVEDVIHSVKGEKSDEFIVRLPYQRFSDHIVARHLLRKYLDTSSIQGIKRSFWKSRPLGRIFQNAYNQFQNPGWAQALIQEFPTRVKGHVPDDERELFFYLPRRTGNVYAYEEPFRDGLFWRNLEAFSSQTIKIVNYYLEDDNNSARLMIDVLIALATKSEHICSAKYFYEFLQKKGFQERELFWSEYIRSQAYRMSVERLLDWIEQPKITIKSSGDTYPIIILLSLFLTTTDHILRDRATRGLVILGEEHPGILLNHTMLTLDFNDPYVPERMLAAVYGVGLSKWICCTEEFKNLYSTFARDLVKLMFLPGAFYGTHHALIRDYALGIIEIALKINPSVISRKYRKYLRPPFSHIKSPFKPANRIRSADVDRKTRAAILTDFSKYSMGRLIEGRGNYDFEHAEYKKIKTQIESRILDLGYDEKQFGDIDRMIARLPYMGGYDSGQKIDRYGKKFSWIAYFEMWGLRRAQELIMNEDYPRPSDSDIDPTFPIKPPAWFPHLADLFISAPSEYLQWVANGPAPNYSHLLEINEINNIPGPWVLLNGYIQQTAPDQRQVFSFLRGLFISSDKIEAFKSEYFGSEYPGNSAIPDPGGDYYTFAGETCWAKQCGYTLRNKNGKAKRQIRYAFTRYENRPKRGAALQTLTIKLGNQEYSFAQKPSDCIRVAGVPVELPSWGYNWESYHSAINDVLGWETLSPAIAEKLRLFPRNRSIELYDSTGRQATVYRSQTCDNQAKYNMLYIRKDLLVQYLKETNQNIIWAIWGERGVHYTKFEALQTHPEMQRIRSSYQEIHRRMYIGISPQEVII